MGILGFYIVTEILKLLMPIWLSLGFLMFILEWLARVFKTNASMSTIILLYAYKIPAHLQLVFPVAVIVTIFTVFGRMNRSREIVAAQAMGVRVRSLLVPACVGVGLAGLLNYWVMNTLSPWGMRAHYELYDRAIDRVPSRFSQIRQERIWYRNRDVLYNVGFFETEKNELYDVTIYTFDDDFQIAQTIYAKRAQWNGSNWTLSDGNISLTDRRLDAPVTESFKTRSTRLIEDPKSLKRIEFNPETMSQSELARAIRRSRSLGINTAKWEVFYQSRHSFFVVAFIFVFLAFPISMRFQRTGGMARETTFVSVVSLVYWLMFNFGINLGNAGKFSPVFAAWAPSLLFMVIVYFYVNSHRLRRA